MNLISLGGSLFLLGDLTASASTGIPDNAFTDGSGDAYTDNFGNYYTF